MLDRESYKRACVRVWNQAEQFNIPLHYALGFFTAMDWYQIAAGELNDDALTSIMRDIAARPDLQQLISEERR